VTRIAFAHAAHASIRVPAASIIVVSRKSSQE
jgi:hypothetical protein